MRKKNYRGIQMIYKVRVQYQNGDSIGAENNTFDNMEQVQNYLKSINNTYQIMAIRMVRI